MFRSGTQHNGSWVSEIDSNQAGMLPSYFQDEALREMDRRRVRVSFILWPVGHGSVIDLWATSIFLTPILLIPHRTVF
jgi:hypothetical protein